MSTVYLCTEFLQCSATVRSTHTEDMEDFTKAVSVKVRNLVLQVKAVHTLGIFIRIPQIGSASEYYIMFS